MLDRHKEITPVVYNETSVKYLFMSASAKGTLCFPMHWHDRIEILRIVSGSLILHLEGKTLPVYPGQAVIIGPHTMHSGISGPDGSSYHVLMFEPERFRNLTKASERYIDPICNLEITFRTVTDNPLVLSAIDDLIPLVTEQDANSLYAVGCVYRILAALYRHCSDGILAVPKTDPALKSVLEYLNTSYAEKISVRDLSHRFGYNESYFCRRFKAETGYTLTNYLFLLRMEAAQKLLCSTSEDIGTIGEMCGFSDIGYFSNCFKKHFGCSPSKYRSRI